MGDWYKRSIGLGPEAVLLVVSVTYILVMACGSIPIQVTSHTPSLPTTPMPALDTSNRAQVGDNIGDIAPGFSILLTNGETISHSQGDGIPTFLFFFSPF